MNRVFLTGHLTRQPELKLTPTGVKVCNFGLASNERWTDQETGELRESVTFVECESWNRTAESVFEYFKKGDPMLIEGSLRFESWENEDGQRRSRLKIRVSRWEFMRQREVEQTGHQDGSTSRTDTEQGTPETPVVDTETENVDHTPSEEQPPF